LETNLSHKREIRYFAAIHFLMTSVTSFWGYCTNYFRDIGFSSTEIGNLNSIGTFSAMLLLPLIGMISDKIQSPRKMMFLLVAAMLPASLLLAFSGMLGLPYWVFVLLSALIITARQSANPMMESWAGGEVTRLGYSYGSIRRYGSFGFICISLFGTVMLGPVLPTWTTMLCSAIVCLPLLWMVGSSRGNAYAAPAAAREKKTGSDSLFKLIFRNYYFVTYLFLVMAFDLFLGIINLDMSYLMDYVGAKPSMLGLVGGVRAATEIVVMIFLSRRKKLPPFWVMLTASGFLIALEHLLYPAAGSVLGLCIITMFCSGLSGGMFYGFGHNYVFQILDRRASGTAMAVLGVAKSLVGVIGTGLGGRIIDAYGVTTLTTGVGVLALILSVLFLLSCVLGRLVWKKPYVSELTSVG